MKLLTILSSLLVLGNFAFAETWLTDSKKAVEVAKADSKAVVVWVAKEGATIPEEFASDSKLKNAVLLKIELGSKDAEGWKKSRMVELAEGGNAFFIMDLNGNDESGKPHYVTAYKPLKDAKLEVNKLEEWYGSAQGSTITTTAPAAIASTPVVQAPLQGAVALPAARAVAPVGNTYQAIAQARADAMARNGGSCTHNIPGAPARPSNVFEGVGHASGGAMPPTCVGSGAVLADATARGANGLTYRVRFYSGN